MSIIPRICGQNRRRGARLRGLRNPNQYHRDIVFAAPPVGLSYQRLDDIRQGHRRRKLPGNLGIIQHIGKAIAAQQEEIPVLQGELTHFRRN